LNFELSTLNMKIVVNTRLLLKDKMDGIGWFANETLKRIATSHPEHEFIFLFDRKFSDEFIFSKNVTGKILFPPTRHPLLLRWWLDVSVKSFLEKTKPDLFLSPDGFLPLSYSGKMLPVMHDLNFIHFPEKIKMGWGKYYSSHFSEAAQKATRIATVSEFSKMDIAKQFHVDEKKIDVVYNGSSEIYKPVSEEVKNEVRKKYSCGENYFLFVGSLYKRKNIKNLLLAFEEFKNSTSSKVKLVIAGKKIWWSEEVTEVFSKMKFKDEVIFTGRLSLEELAKVTASAFALTYVSLFEGFGIPLVEAMNCNVPLITSNVSSMPEIAGDAGLLVEPTSVDSISLAMKKISVDEMLRKSLIEKGKVQRQNFSWDKSAQLLWKSVERSL
jgi:glycosyltransferase involved in cell wall biosynthesis